MYSEEIDQFLRDRNYRLTCEEYGELNPQKNPQISRLYYDTGTNLFHLYAYDGYEWTFYIKND